MPEDPVPDPSQVQPKLAVDVLIPLQQDGTLNAHPSKLSSNGDATGAHEVVTDKGPNVADESVYEHTLVT